MNPEDLAWAEHQIGEYSREFPRYQRYADVLLAVLKGVAREYAPGSIVQARPKEIASFAGKIWRKRHESNDPVHQFTDLCGGRVITNTQDEVTAVCAYIEEHFEIDRENSVTVAQRLKPSEFGYRSVHYIVKFRPGEYPAPGIDVKIPEDIYGLKAEIQVRTHLEHAWADFSHKMIYKKAFRVPAMWERQLALLAALLEEADSQLTRVENGLKAYAGNYGVYMSRDRIQREMAVARFLLTIDPGDAGMADELASLAMAAGDWNEAVEVLTPFAGKGSRQVLVHLGIALCRMHDGDPAGPGYRRGQEYLEAALSRGQEDSHTLASLAGTWRKIDDGKARDLYRRAFELDPSDPFSLSYHLDYLVEEEGDLSFIPLMRPALEAAIGRSRQLTDVGLDLPWGYYNMGKFHFLLGDPVRGLSSYAKAIQLTSEPWILERGCASWKRMACLEGRMEGYAAVAGLLDLGMAALSTRDIPAGPDPESPGEPPVIIAGAYDGSSALSPGEHREILLEAFRDFRGRIIMAGSGDLLGEIVSDAAGKYQGAFQVERPPGPPAPHGGSLDRTPRSPSGVETADLLPMIRCWDSILRGGTHPREVRVLGIGGGVTASLEYRLALALGARVGILQASGGEAAVLLTDDDWRGSENLIPLPPDRTTLRAFIGSGTPLLDPGIRDTLAMHIHREYQEAQFTSLKSQLPSIQEWASLREDFRESNRQQADYLVEKLKEIGCTVRSAGGRQVTPMRFTDDEVQRLAEMEHGRWNAERLAGGWRYGKEKDVNRKISPYLVPWSTLPEEIKEWDRQAVRNIPEFLARVGLEIVRSGFP
jgi:ppGpp synthetase/RelA/SpoT-type nucleotidyltranferase